MSDDSPRYRAYSGYLQAKYGEKVYKLPINLPGTCPNRDGRLGRGGCIYCEPTGAGFNALPANLSVKQQVETNKEYFRKRFGAGKFISYFQSHTNTYTPLERFRENLSAACGPDIIGISVSTRPDCVGEEYLDALEEVRAACRVDIDVELGLQTVNYHTLEKINRGHTLAEFVDAVGRVHRRGFQTCAHMILNLPWDGMEDVVEGAKFLSALKLDFVKMHSLYIVAGTALGEMYAKAEIEICPLSDYADRAVTFLEYLDPEIVIQRLVGRGPRQGVLFSNWGVSWWKVKQAIEDRLNACESFQGKRYDYL